MFNLTRRSCTLVASRPETRLHSSCPLRQAQGPAYISSGVSSDVNAIKVLKRQIDGKLLCALRREWFQA